MRESLWPAFNLTGTLFNPESIAMALRKVLFSDNRQPAQHTYVEHNDIWHSMLFDSGFSASSKEGVEQRIRSMSDEMQAKFSAGADLIVTFGTAWIYKFTNPARLGANAPFTVGNCHKLPAGDFRRILLSVEEITAMWRQLLDELDWLYPQTRVIFTLSPVRHLKDGMAGNSLSKAILRLAIDNITAGEKDNRVSYFPAFEILTDDLRDYRFYASDMTHPSDEAVGYIFEKFIETYVDPSDRMLLKYGENIRKGFCHRPIVTSGSNYELFKRALHHRYLNLKSRWPEALDPR